MPQPCKHTVVRVVAREEDTEFVECQACGEIFDAIEYEDMAREEAAEAEAARIEAGRLQVTDTSGSPTEATQPEPPQPRRTGASLNLSRVTL